MAKQTDPRLVQAMNAIASGQPQQAESLCLSILSEKKRDDLAMALDAGDVACVQLRLKDIDDNAVRRAAEILLPVAHDRSVDLIMNDRPDLA